MKRQHFILSALVLVILALPAVAQKVSVNFDSAADFSRYRTYSFLESKQPSESKVCHQAILDSIQLKLAKRGLLPAYTGERADLYIVYNAGIRELISIQGYDYSYSSTWHSHYSHNDASEVALHNSQTLVIDVIDAKQNQLVWRGIAADTLVDNAERAIKNIERATKKMFLKFPLKD
jgi:uncharacterized protein DUF4136